MAKKSKFTLELCQHESELLVSFEKKTDCNAFGAWDFFSKLLYAYSPNKNGEWIKKKLGRMNAHIVGFPPDIDWKRKSEKEFLCLLTSKKKPKLFREDVEKMITGLIGELSKGSLMKKKYKFIINDYNGKEYIYNFFGRAREICAFCVLWDLKPHPRNNLEVITKITPENKWPLDNNKTTAVRIYGDPSKTVDELRNQGFPRDSDIQNKKEVPSLKIFRKTFNGALQEHYQLLTREQNQEFQVGRSQIPSSIRNALYEKYNHTCAVCHQKFVEDYLAPDHRVPAIVRPDNLTHSNFLKVLQTLCRSCNQVKREVCKRCPFDKKCEGCSWAYPEKFSLSPTSLHRLIAVSKSKNIPIDEIVSSACDYIEKKHSL